MSIGHATVGDSTVSETVIPSGTQLNAPVDVHTALEDVRRMQEFQPPKPGLMDQVLSQPWIQAIGERLEQGLQSLLDAVNKLLSHLTPPVFNHLPENVLSLFSGFLGFLLILTAMYLFYMILSTLLHLQEKQAKPTAAPSRTFDQALLVNAGHHREQACQHARAGHYEPAMRELFLAVLCLLDEKNLVPYERTRTNREYAEALSPHAAGNLQPAFRMLSRTFEAVRYGGKPLDGEQYAACEAGYRQLEAWEPAHAP